MSDDARASGIGIHESKNKYKMTGTRLRTTRIIMERLRDWSILRFREIHKISDGCAPVPIVRTRLRDNGIKSSIIAKRRNRDRFQLNNRALPEIISVPSSLELCPLTNRGRNILIPCNISMRNIIQLSENEAENNERARVE